MADFKDPEDGLQYFVSVDNLIGRIDYEAVHYQVKESTSQVNKSTNYL